MEKQKEKKFLNSLYDNYVVAKNVEYIKMMRNASVEAFKPYIKKDAVATQTGCGIGYMTGIISPLVKQLDVIDGCEGFIEKAKSLGLNNANFYCMLFEEITAENRYDCVFMNHVAEHLVDPVDVLKRLYKATKPGGYIFITVPNATAASRQLAKAMGFLYDLYELTPNDNKGGHRRVYDKDSLSKDVIEAGFGIEKLSGLLFKPFADFQMEELLTNGFLQKEHVKGLLELGEIYPDLCGDVLLIGRKYE